ncbi:hypothetical protein D3C72_2158120 [compost metagenome]
MQLRVMHAHTALGASGVQLLAQQAVRAHPTSNHYALHAGVLECVQGFLHQHLDDRRLRGSRQIGLARIQRLTQLLGLGQHGSLQAGK